MPYALVNTDGDEIWTDKLSDDFGGEKAWREHEFRVGGLSPV